MSQPNILIFMTDHQRGDTVLPEHPAITPNVDRLAREGVTFSETYCPSPHCCPSRATFMTGLYPTRSGIWNNVCNRQALSYSLNDGARLWSENLKDAGYHLAFSGKWHVSAVEGPKDRGWEELHVAAGPGRVPRDEWERYRRMASQPEPTVRAPGQYLRPGYGANDLYGAREDGASYDLPAVENALEAMPRLASSNSPWVLFVGMLAPHDPYYVPQRFLDLYDLDDVPLPPSFHDTLDDKPRIYRRMRRQVWDQLSEQETRDAIRHYWASCTQLDEHFGRLLSALDDLGQADNTLVLYCADHGDYCGDHGLFAKGIPCFRGAYNVPAVMRWPQGIADPGRRVDSFVSLADFGQTFTELAGSTPAPDLSGRSLSPFLGGETPEDWRDDIHTQCNGVELYYSQRSVRTKEFRYVFNGFDDDELYDLRVDPHEMRNVAMDEAYADVKRQMVRRMWRFAHREDDSMVNDYCTVALAPYGPMEAFRDDDATPDDVSCHRDPVAR